MSADDPDRGPSGERPRRSRPRKERSEPAADESADDAVTLEASLDGSADHAPGGTGFAACPGCGALVPDNGVAENPEVNASPGCWAAYGDLLAREYGEWGHPPIHRLTVDTYAAQHPGTRSMRSTRSLAVHLIGLYLAMERGVEPHRLGQEIGRLVADPSAFRWLDPPPPQGQVTILDVRGAETLKEHTSRVRRWALSVWEAWSDHHETIRRWAGR